ncbi:hypothetical protein [Catenuloplanes atrovinosus]|uniref:Uncharacterized protein n=1 Tax=Catenuloplanes atrovinosus TaxID=137266 RepID=A0AAE3YQ96_9ACTN|nr:hypothetical protein [Catenuloplanes atrovinosus]MDR7276354.1 hypothetical protein [Catenuloplanes atrovinosus]
MDKRTWASVIAATAGLAAGLTSPATAASRAADAPVGEVRNTSEISVGAIQAKDGSYRHGTYDDLIPPGRFSGYASTAGVYVGPGWCIRIRYWTSGTEQNPPQPHQLGDPRIYQGGDRGQQVWFQGGIGADVRALRSTHADCHPA